MDFAGLIGKFRANRPLTEQEREYRLDQQERLDVAPHYQLGVIEMNSTSLEMVDKWYGERGTITAVMLTIVVGVIVFFGAMLHLALTRAPDAVGGGDDVGLLVFLAVLSAPLLAAAGWALRKEMFAYTHYPLQFNRITRTVHVFRPDGITLSVPWNDVFFTLAPVDHVYKFWNILGHVMADDGLTVKESFALSMTSEGSPDGVKMMRSHWEFVRRYMEDGPGALHAQVQFCMPIKKRRETFHVAMHRLMIEGTGGARLSNPLQVFGLLFNLLVLPFRLLAIYTSKIPRWPAEVEARSAAPDNDPYAIAGSPNGDRVAVFPAAAQAAGVRFTGAPDDPLAVPKVAAMSGRNAPASSATRGRNKRG